MRPKLTFRIPLHGNPSLTVEGVKGESCKDVTAALEAALGTVVSDTPTNEFYERPLEEQVKQY